MRLGSSAGLFDVHLEISLLKQRVLSPTASLKNVPAVLDHSGVPA